MSTARKLVLVCGPPGAGKSTYVADRLSPGDLVWDHDAVFAAISGQPLHSRPPGFQPVLLALRTTVSSVADTWPGTVWFILSAPTPGERAQWQDADAQVVVLLTSPDLCAKACRGRPPGVDWDAAITQWYARWSGGCADLVIARPEWWS